MSDRAYSALKEKLLTLEGGAYLSARQFANEIGISYTPAREAFLRLQNEGALKQVPNVGFFVASMDINEMLQSFQVRECIEPFVLQKVIAYITGSHIALMRGIAGEQKLSLDAGDIAKYMKLDIKLHEVLLDVYGNPHLKSVYHTVREQYMYCSSRIALSFYPDALEEHLNLIGAIEAGDIDLSLKTLYDHMNNAKQRMMEGHIKVIE
ncbi:MAG: GntR family transcriptional regulator [Synergistaceae bacterium]|nr:GntR family transcriptional regulator [Synergistaceae bacterium]